jgi:hypothetical protein
MVSKLVSCAPPTFTGGGPSAHVLSYQWFAAGGSTTQALHIGQEWEVEEAVIGQSVYCRVAVGDGETTVTDDSNTIGPVIPQPTIGDLSLTVNGQPYNSETGVISKGTDEVLTLEVTYSGDASQVIYEWTQSGGGGKLFSNTHSATATYNTGMTASTARLSVGLRDVDASDSPVGSIPIVVTVM